MDMAGTRSSCRSRISRASDAQKAEQEIDRAQPLGGEELLQVPAPERARRRQSRAERQHAEAGQIPARLSRSRADRAVVSIGGAQGAGGKVLRCPKLRDSGVVLLDGD